MRRAALQMLRTRSPLRSTSAIIFSKATTWRRSVAWVGLLPLVLVATRFRARVVRS